tara:strand:- start:11948 stop:12325 length:378 start_codon:yes stop_codon:yes gene_type:complete
MKKQLSYISFVIYLLLSFCAHANSSSELKLRQVASNQVCMMNDTLFEGEQIKVTLDNKDYYGCCAMCKNHLKRDKKIRQAYDPLSGKQVDKAKAIIGIDKKGNAYYFENEKNLKAYRLPILKENR